MLCAGPFNKGPVYFGVMKKRIAEYDILKGLSVIFMIAVHVFIVNAENEVYKSLFGQVIGLLGGVPAAPVFMFCMGALLGVGPP